MYSSKNLFLNISKRKTKINSPPPPSPNQCHPYCGSNMSQPNECEWYTVWISKPDWFETLHHLNRTKIEKLEIVGNSTSPLSLKRQDLVNIINEAIRFKCDSLSFMSIDFREFFDFVVFSSGPFSTVFPVTKLYFENCASVTSCISQIFNTASDIHREYRVRDITFSRCLDDFITLKRRIVTGLTDNYYVLSIRYIYQNSVTPPSPSSSSQYDNNDRLNRQINKLLRRNRAIYFNYQDCVLTLFAIKKFRPESLLGSVPRDIMLMLAKIIYEMTYKQYNNKENTDEGLTDDDAELIYDRHQLSRGHLDVFKLHYNKDWLAYLTPLQELRRKKVTLNRLVISGEDMLNGSIYVISEIIINTNTKILEVYGVNFGLTQPQRFNYHGENYDGENFNGDDSRIGEITDLEYPELQLEEVHFTMCKNIPIFLEFLLKLTNKWFRYDERVNNIALLPSRGLQEQDRMFSIHIYK